MTPRPPLTLRQRRGAVIAGIIGFVLFGLALTPLEFILLSGDLSTRVIAFCAAGVIVAIGSVVVSIRLLKRYGVTRPAVVTVVATVMGIVVHFVLANLVLGVVLEAGASAAYEGVPDFWSSASAGYVIVGILLVIDAGIGSALWLGLAHAARRGEPGGATMLDANSELTPQI